jgi:mRNA-degrading endonuclease toxin of MazEF toxin-antitoxin module
VVSVNRGDIYWVDFGPIENRAPAKLRPLLIVQVDDISNTAIGTVVGGAFTSNLDAKNYKGAVFVPKEVSGLSNPGASRHPSKGGELSYVCLEETRIIS